MHFAAFLPTILAGVIFIDAYSSRGVSAASKLNVMSANLRTSNANDPPPNDWNTRSSRFRQLVKKYDPDLLCTQEGAPDQIAYIANVLMFNSTGECAGECGANERNSIFYKPDRFELLSSHTFALSNTPNILPSNSWDLEYLRAAVVARFRDRSSNRNICILNTHFDTTRGQPQSAVLCAQLIQQNCQPSDNLVMTGDLNTTPESLAIQYLLGKATIDGRMSPVPLFETLTAVGAGGPTWIGPSFGGQVSGSKIDYIFSRGDHSTCVRSGKVLTDTFPDLSSSDHAIVQTEFCIGDGCTQPCA